jgi:predicted RNA-binding Zn-ribbon protein involved in translation (DUF1610 family)
MPHKPSPTTYHCPACKWSKTVAPASDALIDGVTGFTQCPNCGNQDLETKSANIVQGTVAKVLSQIERVKFKS